MYFKPIPEFSADTLERFDSQVDRTSDCWVWNGKVRKGYGRFRTNGEEYSAHRVSYTRHRGPIPDGLVTDHLCRNRRCVNPDHLEVVTQRVNVLRGEGLPAANAKKSRCKRGHRLTPDNLTTAKGRICRTCHRDYHREYQRRLRALNRTNANADS